MNEMLSKIFLEGGKYDLYKSKSRINSLENLSRINVFIGPNNSGKSKLLRTLFADKDLAFGLKEIDFSELNNLLNEISMKLTQDFITAGISDVSNSISSGVLASFREFQQTARALKFSNVNGFVSKFNEFWQSLLEFSYQGGSGLPNRGGADFSSVNGWVRSIGMKYNLRIRKAIPDEVTYSVERVYIPILRGLRPTELLDSDKYVGTNDNYQRRTIRDYFKKAEINHSGVHTGLRLYEDIRRMLLGKQEERLKIKKFEDFLSRTFFNGNSVSLIPNIDDDSLHISIASDEWPIYEMGDGIQSIIVLLYPLFFNQGKSMLFFFEEPEISMHPGLQRLFLETLMLPEFDSFQYFIATHSNHFLDITVDLGQVSIYSFNRCPDGKDSQFRFEVENSSNEDLKLLDLLGVRNSSVFLSNCTIWVEGITDRLYIKKYLDLYQEDLVSRGELRAKFREDYHFSFIEYGGGNVAHCSFGSGDDEEADAWETIKAKKITSRIFLVADKDDTDLKPESKKAKRLNTFKKDLDDHFYKTEGIEIENSLSAETLVSTIRELEGDGGDLVAYEASEVMEDKFKGEKMGFFIERHFRNLNRKYKADSGTIYPKLEFCRAAVRNMKAAGDLSQEAMRLSGKIFQFIRVNNE